MFLVFLACLTYFWLWLETACLPVCEIQSCAMAAIWVSLVSLVLCVIGEVVCLLVHVYR